MYRENLYKSLLKTLRPVWIVYSVLGILPVIAVLLFPAGLVLKATPTCYSIKYFGQQCFMCGSTRSFILAGQGKFAEAIAMNKISFILFFLILANTIVLIYTLTKNKKHETA
jgi:hypothetical protein